MDEGEGDTAKDQKDIEGRRQKAEGRRQKDGKRAFLKNR